MLFNPCTMITFVVEKDGVRQTIEVPEDMNLNLMEVLKASDYPIEATCGGMALCATCYVEVLEGKGELGTATDAELDMLDTLPSANPNSRLACQIKITPVLQDAVFQLPSSHS